MRGLTRLFDVGTWPIPAQIGYAVLAVAGMLGLASVGLRGPTPAADPPQVTAFLSTPGHLTSLWIGDGYTAGVGTSGEATAESCLTASALSWSCAVDAERGTGFLAGGAAGGTTRPLPDRLAQDTARFPAPDVVVVDAGRADLAEPLADFRRAVRGYLGRLSAAYPDARIVVITPYLLTSNPGDAGPQRAFLIGQARLRHWTVVDPLGAGWPTRLAALTSADAIDPTAAGHRAIAAHLAGAFRAAPALRALLPAHR